MHLRELADLLQASLGLSAAEARAYAKLSVNGPSTAGELAKALQLHRNEVYRVGQRLVAMQLVAAGLERPTRYRALPPAMVFRERIERLQQELDTLDTAAREVDRMLACMGRRGPSDPETTYRVVHGRAEIHKLCRRVVAGASSRIEWVSTRRGALARAVSTGGIARVCSRAADEGARVRLAFRADTLRERAALGELATVRGIDVRVAPDEAPIELLLADGREVILWALDPSGEHGPEGAEVAIHATAPALVAAQQLCIDLVCARALRLPPLQGDAGAAGHTVPSLSPAGTPRPALRTQA